MQKKEYKMIEIHVPVVNNPEFIRLQYQACQKFCQDPFRFVVFNDSKPFPDHSNWNQPGLRDEITKVCEELGITCIPIDNQEDAYKHSPSDRHARTANFMWREYQSKSQVPILCLDSDMFPVSAFSILQDLQAYDFAIVPQERGGQLFAWPNLWWMDPTKIPNHHMIDWRTDHINGIGTDTGGKSWRWFQQAQVDGTTKVHKIFHQYSTQWSINNNVSRVSDLVLEYCANDVRNQNGKCFCEIYEHRFLHLRAGSNWDCISQDIHTTRTQKLAQLLEQLGAQQNE